MLENGAEQFFFTQTGCLNKMSRIANNQINMPTKM